MMRGSQFVRRKSTWNAARAAWLPVWLLVAGCAQHAAADFLELRPYGSVKDARFRDFGFQDSLQLEDFDDGKANTPGMNVLPPTDPLSSGRQVIRPGYAVGRSDGVEGQALEVMPSSCTSTFPPQCPSSVAVEFEQQAEWGMLPTYVGFAWTDAVRQRESDVHPWARVTITDGDGVRHEQMIKDLPLASQLKSAHDDDVLVSFASPNGIHRMELTVVSNGMPGSGHLAIDDLQFGISALPGDADVDGDVDFQDFLTLSDAFGEGDTWRSGDFNRDGRAGFEDFLLLADNFGYEMKAASVSAVPEPTGASAVICALVGGLCLRRRVFSSALVR